MVTLPSFAQGINNANEVKPKTVLVGVQIGPL